MMKFLEKYRERRLDRLAAELQTIPIPEPELPARWEDEDGVHLALSHPSTDMTEIVAHLVVRSRILPHEVKRILLAQYERPLRAYVRRQKRSAV